MKISFLGKGGSGKTTISGAFIRWLSEKSEVIAIDADLNVHLQNTLGIEGDLIEISERINEIKDYLRGNRNDITNDDFLSTTPPSKKSRFIKPTKNDPFIKKFSIQKGNISFMKVGSYNNEDIGHNCYHSKLGSLEHIFHHMLDEKNDYVISDATAGVDNLGTSLFYSYDINFFVVEPTEKSASVFLDFLKHCEEKKVKVYAIGNKIEDEEDLEFLKNKIGEKSILTWIPYEKSIRKFEQGDNDSMNNFIEKNKEKFSLIKEKIDSIEKDWKKYHSNLVNAHKEGCQSWWNDYYKKDLASIVDYTFSYEDTIKKK